jgi:hypothetical protein
MRRVALPDIQLTSVLVKRASRVFRSAVSPTLILLSLTSTPLFAAEPVPSSAPSVSRTAIQPIELPRELGISGWKARNESRILTSEQFAVVQGGEVFLEYGLQRVVTRTYQHGNEAMTIEVFETRFPTGAYGLLTFNRRNLPAYRRELQFGRYVVSLSMQDSKHRVSEECLSSVREIFASQGSADPPPLVTHLPKLDRIENSERYIVGAEALRRADGFSSFANFVDFAGGVEIAIADYRVGGGTALAIVEYHTPQAASFGYDSAYNEIKALPDAEKDKHVLKRTGNYVIAANLTSGTPGDIGAVRALLDQVKYEMVVYWEGSKFSSIPIQFRPPDPAALEEFRETTKVLLRTFYGIGLLLLSAIVLGIFAGWAVFYWRRQRRRRMGTDEYFSDAGETVRLNLDDYLFQPNEQSIKLIGKGDA